MVSFDDAEEAKFVTPPLTTVRQPIYELGRQATEMLLASMAGQEVPEQVSVSTRLIVRQSCGCLGPAIDQAVVGQVKGITEGWSIPLEAEPSPG